MKKLLIFSLMVLLLTGCNRNKTRQVEGTITNKVGNIIEVETTDENVWEYEEEEQTKFSINDTYMINFNTNNTSKVTDDIIISINK